MTIGDIETKVRETLLAEHTPDGTYPAYFIVSNIFDGIRMLNSVCPQSRYRGIKLVRDIEFPFLTKNSAASDVTSAESMDFPCDPRWERAVRCFAVSKCLDMDAADDFTLQRAQAYLAEFNALARS